MEHPGESKREAYAATVEAVHPDTWEVDVRSLYASAGIVRRVKVLGHYLPEVHTRERDSKVIVAWLDAYQQAPVCWPIHNTMMPAPELKANHVYWSEHLAYRMRITRDGVLEIRNAAGPLLQIQVLEEDGVVRIDTPRTRVILRDSDGSITAECEGDCTVDAGGNIEATAGGNVAVDAGGNISAVAGGNIHAQADGQALVKATAIQLVGPVTITGALTVAGTIAASGNVTGNGGSTSTHSH